MKRVAIIGAGVAGAAAAYAMHDEVDTVTIFEKSRGFSGRAATRRRGDVCYDHGANFFKTDSDRVYRIVREELSSIALARIDPDVWTFNKDGAISKGDASDNEEERWTYRTGIHRLGKRLARASEADVHFETRITRLKEQDDGRWKMDDQDENEYGAYNVVLLTPPAPQTAELLRASRATSADTAVQQLADALSDLPYRSQLTVVLGYDQRLTRPDDFYGLVNSDGGHDVAWLSFEEDKPGHVPDEESVLIAQMSPQWSTERLEADPEEYTEEAAQAVATLLDNEDVAQPAWTDTQRWRYALPEEPSDTDLLETSQQTGLFFAGDAFAPSGRVQRALETGLDVAEPISER